MAQSLCGPSYSRVCGDPFAIKGDSRRPAIQTTIPRSERPAHSFMKSANGFRYSSLVTIHDGYVKYLKREVVIRFGGGNVSLFYHNGEREVQMHGGRRIMAKLKELCMQGEHNLYFGSGDLTKSIPESEYFLPIPRHVLRLLLSWQDPNLLYFHPLVTSCPHSAVQNPS